jgi:hypothetical protein
MSNMVVEQNQVGPFHGRALARTESARNSVASTAWVRIAT